MEEEESEGRGERRAEAGERASVPQLGPFSPLACAPEPRLTAPSRALNEPPARFPDLHSPCTLSLCRLPATHGPSSRAAQDPLVDPRRVPARVRPPVQLGRRPDLAARRHRAHLRLARQGQLSSPGRDDRQPRRPRPARCRSLDLVDRVRGRPPPLLRHGHRPVRSCPPSGASSGPLTRADPLSLATPQLCQLARRPPPDGLLRALDRLARRPDRPPALVRRAASPGDARGPPETRRAARRRETGASPARLAFPSRSRRLSALWRSRQHGTDSQTYSPRRSIGSTPTTGSPPSTPSRPPSPSPPTPSRPSRLSHSRPSAPTSSRRTSPSSSTRRATRPSRVA